MKKDKCLSKILIDLLSVLACVLTSVVNLERLYIKTNKNCVTTLSKRLFNSYSINTEFGFSDEVMRTLSNPEKRPSSRQF